MERFLEGRTEDLSPLIASTVRVLRGLRSVSTVAVRNRQLILAGTQLLSSNVFKGKGGALTS